MLESGNGIALESNHQTSRIMISAVVISNREVFSLNIRLFISDQADMHTVNQTCLTLSWVSNLRGPSVGLNRQMKNLPEPE